MTSTRAGALLAIGETMAMVTPAAAERLSDAVEFRVDAGGAESNVAAHAAAFGAAARWFSRLGDDPLGHRIARQLAERRVDVSSVEFDPGHPTGVYFKDPGHGVRYYRGGSAAAHLAPADADAVDFDAVELLHVSGITAAISATAAAFLDAVIGRAREAGVRVSFDVNHRAPLWSAEVAAAPLLTLARRADIVFVGRDEAEHLWATTDAASVRALLPDVAELVLKDGDVGATAFTGAETVFEPAQQVEIVEAVGAGDAFAGGYLSALLEALPVAERLRRGHRRAALTLQTTSDSVDERTPA
ncbi:sugar kinase [Microbacterium sp. 4R-513]|uniref:sugar kinase n=1 Tax=Microbacterium sp. 4R-513 TaxID=2567934 RepID=UPI0013E16372|nr:sugar kinase [Microbacterium sp. 4R-513]QIG38681.1 sugar kinase [Microbacterium sp. 4R-513]